MRECGPARPWTRSSQSRTAADSGSPPLTTATPCLPCFLVHFQRPFRWRYPSRTCLNLRQQSSSQASARSRAGSAPRSDVAPTFPLLKTLGKAVMLHNPREAQLTATMNMTSRIRTLTSAPAPPMLAQIQATRIRNPTQSRPLRHHNTRISLAPHSPPHPPRPIRLGGNGSPCGSRLPQTMAQSGAGSGVDLPV